MEVSCLFLSLADWSARPADWFNNSWQETWGFGFWFRRGDHKAVKRLEPARSSGPGVALIFLE
jgi:hypothetical protein